MAVEVMCALCGDGVADAELDPCALVVVTRWRAPEREQREQQFFAHARCIVRVLHPDVRGHAEVLDLASGPA